MPNSFVVFSGILGEGDDRRRVLFCREIDTNLDGLKDVVRTYNDKGDAVDEQADTNYDDKIDTWIRFSGGHIAKVEVDTNGDGKPDEPRFYVKESRISRIQRDTNLTTASRTCGRIYTEGQLERMGVDLDFDGHVDRWDRDEVAHRAAEERAAGRRGGGEKGRRSRRRPATPDPGEPTKTRLPLPPKGNERRTSPVDRKEEQREFARE